MQGWIIAGVMMLWDGVLFPVLKSFLKITTAYVVINFIVETVFSYISLYMAAFLVLAGNWWPALGGDVIVSITLEAIKLRVALSIASMGK